MIIPYHIKVGGGLVTFETDKTAATFLSETRLYYGADERLRIADRKTCYFIRYETQCSTDRLPLGDADRGAFEEYRYDALGRRILVRTRTDPLCQSRCTNALRRVVWDGDQMLYEISAPGGTGASEAEMERDVGHHQSWHFTQDHFPYGRVVYAHGADLDHPLSMMRMEYSDSLPGPVLLIPHMNQASAYDTATFSENRCREYQAPKPQVITLTDPDSAYETKLHCVEVDWPAPYLTATRDKRPLLGSISWMGSLIDEKRDASGQMYMRNRYYDPSTGRFTQEDPIGLAGGLNLYGFANGDPVSYSDPYGLCPPRDNNRSDCPSLPFGGQSGPVRGRPGSFVGALLYAVGEAAQNWWSEHGSDVIAIGLAVASDGLSAEEGGWGGKLQPHAEAQGPHTSFKRNPDTGEVTGYETYRPQTNPRNPSQWEPVKRFDRTGSTHFNKATQQQVPTPHVHEPITPGGVRPAQPEEIP